jgi:hypothetical protein
VKTEAPAPTPRTAYIAYGEARPVLDAFHASLAAELAGKTAPQIKTAWPAWTAQHDAASLAGAPQAFRTVERPSGRRSPAA